MTVSHANTITTTFVIAGDRRRCGSLPLLLGLVIVMPVLGHATWHLYRKVVVR